jgi:hypothetical protein
MNFSQWMSFASFFPMSDIEDDISSRMFSGKFYFQDNLLGSETSHYEGIGSMSQLNTSAIYVQALQLCAAANVFLNAGFTLSCRHHPLQPVCRELNSHLFAFFKNHFSLSRTNSSHVSNSGSVSYLAQSTVPYVSETFKNIRTYQKNDIKNLQFLYCFRKTPSKFAFFC